MESLAATLALMARVRRIRESIRSVFEIAAGKGWLSAVLSVMVSPGFKRLARSVPLHATVATRAPEMTSTSVT